MSKKMIIYIVAIVVLTSVVAVIFYMLKGKVGGRDIPDTALREYATGVHLYNDLDKRVLTKQGELLIMEAIENEDYSIEVVNTTYDGKDGWKSRVEKGIWLWVNYPDYREPDLYIIPTELAYWREGAAFLIHSFDKKVDKIQFNNFILTDYLNEDPNFVRETGVKKREVSLMLTLTGQNMGFSVAVNGKNVEMKNPPEMAIDGVNSFYFSVPLNKYLMLGRKSANTVEISSIKPAVDAGLHVTLSDSKRQNISLIDQDVKSSNLVEGGGQQFSFQIEADWELIDQSDLGWGGGY